MEVQYLTVAIKMSHRFIYTYKIKVNIGRSPRALERKRLLMKPKLFNEFSTSTTLLSDNESNNSSVPNSPQSSNGEDIDRTKAIAAKFKTREQIEGYFTRKQESIENSNLSQVEKDYLLDMLSGQEEDVKDLVGLSIAGSSVANSPSAQSEDSANQDQSSPAEQSQDQQGANVAQSNTPFQDSSNITGEGEPFDIFGDDS